MNTVKTKTGQRLAYFLSAGDADKPPILFVHGFPLDHRTWSGVTATSRIEIKVDLPGFGNSELPVGEGSMEAYAAALADLLDDLAAQKAILCGHSMGGYVCLETLSRYPDRVAGLALVGSQPLADTPAKIEDRRALITRLQSVGISAVEGMAEKLGFGGVGHELFYQIIGDQSPAAAVFATQAMMGRVDHTRELLEANIPKLVVHGAKDEMVPFNAYPRELRDHGVRVEILQQVGHSPMVERPRTFSTLLSAWLNDRF